MALKQMKAFADKGKIEDLHQLRVTLKKIRSVYQFLKSDDLSDRFKKKYKSKFRPFFTDAGNLRRLQLFRIQLEKHRWKELIQYSPSLKNESTLTSLFQQQSLPLEKYISHMIDRMEAYAKKIGFDDGFQYAVSLKMNVIKQIRKPVIRQWHSVRKEIKRLLYAYHFLDHTHQLRLLTVKQYKELDYLQEAIGQWHDQLDFHEWLSKEGFSMSEFAGVKKEFKKAWLLVRNELKDSEKKVLALMNRLSTQMSVKNK